MANLSFSKGTFSGSGLVTGRIYFDTTTRKIHVATGAAAYETYGNDIKDVTFANGILTILKNGSQSIVLDFSDVASSTDVTKICGALADRVGSLETAVATNTGKISNNTIRIEVLENTMGIGGPDTSLATRIQTLETTVGDDDSGLVKDVNDLQTGLGQANSNITNLQNDKADKATTLAGYGITDAYTKTQVDNKLAGVFHYKGTKTASTALPTSDNSVGDVWNIANAGGTDASGIAIKAGDNVAWNGTGWDVLSGTIDLSAYAKTSEVVTAFGSKQGQITLNSDSTTAWDVNFAMDGQKLQGTVVHSALLDKYKAAGNATHPVYIASNGTPTALTVDTTAASDSSNLVTSGAAAAAATAAQANAKTYTDNVTTLNNLTTMAWATFA